MVMQKMIPSMKASMANIRPPKIIQRMFSSVDGAPPPRRTSFLKGKKATDANLKHCLPMGIPTIVMHHSAPTKTQPRPKGSPPNMNQIILPNVFIVCLSVVAQVDGMKWVTFCRLARKVAYPIIAGRLSFGKMISTYGTITESETCRTLLLSTC